MSGGTFPDVIVEVGFGDTPTSSYFRFDAGRFDTGRFAPDFVGTDVSDDVRSITINRGKQRLLEACGAGTCTIVLDNRAGDYDPNNLSGPYVSAGVSQVKPMVRVRVQAQYGGVWYTKFTGFADSWDQTYPGFGADAVCVLQASDAFKVLARHEPGEPTEAVGAGESTGTRIGRLLTNAGWPTQDRDLDTGIFTTSATTLSTNTLSEMQAVTLSEGGNLYVSTDGLVTFKSRHARYEDTRSNTIQAAFADTGTLRYAGIETGDDDDLIKNSVVGTRTDGTPQSFVDSQSIGDFGIRSYNVTSLWLETDVQVADWVSWVGTLFGDFESRVDSILVKPQRDDALWPVILSTELGDLVSVVRHPRAGDTITKYLFVEGTSHTITAARTWETVLRFSSAAGIYVPGAVWFVLDNATTGKLNTGQLAPF